MSNKKISELTEATPLDGSELIAVVQGGVTKKIRVDSLDGDGGSSALFPNGIKMVTESRDFEADDVGHILLVAGSDIHLTMPLGITFEENKIFAIKFVSSSTNSDYESTNGIVLKPLINEYDGESVTLFTSNYGGNSNIGSINGLNTFDNGVLKTALRYLDDKVNRVVPNYIDDTAADADVNLLSGQTYTLTGSRNLNIKP